MIDLLSLILHCYVAEFTYIEFFVVLKVIAEHPHLVFALSVL